MNEKYCRNCPKREECLNLEDFNKIGLKMPKGWYSNFVKEIMPDPGLDGRLGQENGTFVIGDKKAILGEAMRYGIDEAGRIIYAVQADKSATPRPEAH